MRARSSLIAVIIFLCVLSIAILSNEGILLDPRMLHHADEIESLLRLADEQLK